MNVRVGRRLMVTLLGTGLALVAAAPAAQAAAAPPETSVTVGQLVLAPTDRGYQGTVAITVAYRGTSPANINFTVDEPVIGSFDRGDVGCLFGNDRPAPQRSIRCVPDDFQPGERRTFRLSFRVLTTTRPYAMSAPGILVATYNSANERTAQGTSRETLFRSTTGSVRHPRPYVQDSLAEASITAGEAVLARQSDGSLSGYLPVTVSYLGDAPNNYLAVEPTLPAGVTVNGCLITWCMIPGDAFMAGEQRSFDIPLAAPAGTPSGDLGTGTVEVRTAFMGYRIADGHPADNTATYGVTASGLS